MMIVYVCQNSKVSSKYLSHDKDKVRWELKPCVCVCVQSQVFYNDLHCNMTKIKDNIIHTTNDIMGLINRRHVIKGNTRLLGIKVCQLNTSHSTEYNR